MPTIKLANDEELCIKRRKTSHDVPAFLAIGVAMYYETKRKGYPKLEEVLRDLSKGATWLLWELVRKKNQYSNISHLAAEDQADMVKITRAYKELEGLGIVKRVSKQKYFINPLVIYPKFDRFEEVLEAWKALQKGESNG